MSLCLHCRNLHQGAHQESYRSLQDSARTCQMCDMINISLQSEPEKWTVIQGYLKNPDERSQIFVDRLLPSEHFGLPEGFVLAEGAVNTTSRYLKSGSIALSTSKGT